MYYVIDQVPDEEGVDGINAYLKYHDGTRAERSGTSDDS